MRIPVEYCHTLLTGKPFFSLSIHSISTYLCIFLSITDISELHCSSLHFLLLPLLPRQTHLPSKPSPILCIPSPESINLVSPVLPLHLDPLLKSRDLPFFLLDESLHIRLHVLVFLLKYTLFFLCDGFLF